VSGSRPARGPAAARAATVGGAAVATATETATETATTGVGGAQGGGTLYVVATPIGNLADVTLRALEVLRTAPLIACEDTRVTLKLLERHAIRTRLLSFHARSGPGRLTQLLGHLRAGRDLAVTTDAGTPGVSDPGAELVADWTAEGGRVVPVPGASAVVAAIAATGIAGPRWAFEGFLPRSGRERRDRLARLARDDRGTVLYEAANRLAGTLRDLASACGADRQAAVCRELTKVHEQIVVDPLGALAAATTDGTIPALGEVVIVVGAASGRSRREPTSSARLDEALAEVERRVAAGAARGEAARAVAGETGIPRRQLYRPDEHGATGLGGGSRAARGRSAPPS
jgi:16S rRNA (cytidine1402-2'-O)-methyltransferase